MVLLGATPRVQPRAVVLRHRIYLATGADVVQLVHGPSAPSALAFTPDGTHLVTASGIVTAFQTDELSVKVWRLPDGKEVASLDQPNSVTTIVFSSDPHLMMTGGGNSTTSVWETLRLQQQGWPASGCST